MHAEAKPCENVPVGHCVQPALPLFGAKRPGPQGEQKLRPGEVETYAGEHCACVCKQRITEQARQTAVQDVEEGEDETKPAGHIVGAVRPVPLQYEPLGHATQPAWLVCPKQTKTNKH